MRLPHKEQGSARRSAAMRSMQRVQEKEKIGNGKIEIRGRRLDRSLASFEYLFAAPSVLEI